MIKLLVCIDVSAIISVRRRIHNIFCSFKKTAPSQGLWSEPASLPISCMLPMLELTADPIYSQCMDYVKFCYCSFGSIVRTVKQTNKVKGDGFL